MRCLFPWFSPAFLLLLAPASAAQSLIRSRFVLDDSSEPFERCLGGDDNFGSSLAALGDLNGDGVREFAVGARNDFRATGAVWIFSLNSSRQVERFVKIGPRENMQDELSAADFFGSAVTALDDLDGNGVRELVVGAPGTGNDNSGAIWILFLRPNGSVLTRQEISRTAGGFPGTLEPGNAFGTALAAPGDLDGNGIADLIVGGNGANAKLWFLYLGPGGAAQSVKVLSGVPTSAVAVVGDVDGDGIADLVAGSDSEVRLLFLDANENVRSSRRLLSSGSAGRAVVGLGDLDGNGVPDLACSTSVLRLAADGSLVGQTNFTAFEGSGDGLAAPGDTNGDGRPDLVVGSPRADTRARNTGAITFFDLAPTGAASNPQTVDANSSAIVNSPAPLDFTDSYGRAFAAVGDLNLDEKADVAVGAPADADGFLGAGAVWLHFTDAGSGRRVAKVSQKRSGLPLETGDAFGSSLASLGDLDGNGTSELLVGTPGDDDGGLNRGAAYVLFLAQTGRVDRFMKLSSTSGGLVPGVALLNFGRSASALGDLDGDGRAEVAVGSLQDLFVLFLEADGSVRRSTRIERGLVTGLGAAEDFSRSLAWLEPTATSQARYLVAAGVTEALFRLELDANGQVVGSIRTVGPVTPVDVESLGDVDADGDADLALLGEAGLTFQRMNADFSLASSTRIRVPGALGLGTLGDLTGDGVPDLAVGLRQLENNPHDRALLLEIEGLATAGFERRNALDNFLLENGRQIPVPHPGRSFVISSSGSNLGATIFDSTPGGPNAASQDPDLLVGSGKVLMLQDSSTGTQSAPGIFDRPNDDRDGGLLALDFPGEVRLLALELIDQDTGLGHGTSVTLVDANGRTRTYDVPPGFTEDVHVTHAGGWRTLRLDTLAPQAGYVATATASEQPGFLDARVVRLEVRLSGSGAIDDLVYDPHP